MKSLLITSLALICCFMSFAQSPVTLKLTLEKGKVYKLKNISKQNIQSSYNGMNFTTDVNSSTSIRFTLLSLEKDLMRIEFKIDTIQSKTNSPMGNKETNSAKPAKKTEYMERIMNRFSNTGIIAKISTSGKFMGFENYKAFRTNVLAIMDSIPESKKDQLQKQIDMTLKESAVQSMIESLFVYLPDNAVKTGETWETSNSVSGGGLTGMNFNTITLDSTDQSVAALSLKSELESMPSTDENALMQMNIKGQSTGNMTIDLKTGIIIKSNDKKHYEGVMTVKNQGNEVKMPLTINAQSEIIKQ